MAKCDSYQGVVEAAQLAGAKFPELVAAQWALESNYGKAVSGKNNYFGIKAEPGQEGTVCGTQEEVDGEMQDQTARFADFKTGQDCVNYLVKLWYKDYKNYRGVNTCATREEAAYMLVQQGYATDSQYADKLIRIMKENDSASSMTVAAEGKPAKPAKPGTIAVQDAQQQVKPPSGGKPAKPALLFTLVAVQDTVLKKQPVPRGELEPAQLVEVPKGKTYGVVEVSELAANSHYWVNLASNAGQWFVYGPHWKREIVRFAGAAPVVTGTVSQKSLLVTTTPNWDDFAAYVTKNLTVGEILQWDVRRKPARGSSDEKNILAMAEQFQQIRETWKRPLGVSSFYRPEPINSEVGGVSNSKHITGSAIDVYPIGTSLDEFYNWIYVRWTGGLGDGRDGDTGFIHLDCRGGGAFVPGAGRTPCDIWYY